MRISILASVLALPLLGASLGAQNVIETFTYPNGTNVPGWTERQGGDFEIRNGQLYLPSGSWSYITYDALKNIKDCVQDIEAIYTAGAGVRFAGVTARHDGSATENGLVMLKVQDNTSAGNWNRAFNYERPGGSAFTDLVPPSTRCVARLFVKGNDTWYDIDLDMDGYFEHRSPVRVIAATTTKPDGSVGANAFANAALDNWMYYSGLLFPKTVASQPKIGQQFDMTFSAPLHVIGSATVPTAWIGFLSFKAGRLPLPDGRGIPFDLASAMALWSGVLTTTNPEAALSLPIPNDPTLVGVRFWTNAFTLGMPGQLLGIGHISNEHGAEISR